ncbi:MAG: hypothetical protein ACHQAX_02850 [Gammaproteobacteria bacterium]
MYSYNAQSKTPAQSLKEALNKDINNKDYVSATENLVQLNKNLSNNTSLTSVADPKWVDFFYIQGGTASPYNIVARSMALLEIRDLPAQTVDAYAYLIKHQDSLVHVDMYTNGLASHSIVALLTALAGQDRVQSFDFNGSTNIDKNTNDVSQQLADVLKTASLREFSFYCGKGSKMEPIMQALKENKKLTAVSFKYSLDDEGKEIVNIAEVLAVNTCWKTLVLSDNKMGEGALMLSRALQQNNTLENLHLADMTLSSRDVDTIVDALLHKGNLGALKKIDFGKNELEVSSFYRLEELQKKYPNLEINKPILGNKRSLPGGDSCRLNTCC